MERSYWEKIAPDYNEEIFDVLQNDKKGLISSAIKKLGSPNKSVLDAGCAIGKWLPLLAENFKKVYAADISSGNLAIAKKYHSDLNNVEYVRKDLSAANARLPKADLVICINAILTDSLKKRNLFFHNLSLAVKKGGHLVLVVPSLESWMLSRILQRKFRIDKSIETKLPTTKSALTKYKNVLEGNLDIDYVPTKHYLKEELSILLSRESFIVEKTSKIEYSWKTEFVNPPKWLKEPMPWDWLCVARRK